MIRDRPPASEMPYPAHPPHKVRPAKRLAWGLFLFMPIYALIAVATARALAISEFWLIIPYMIGFFVAATRMAHTPCPRCDGPFFRGRWWSNAFATRCMNRGLPIDAT